MLFVGRFGNNALGTNTIMIFLDVVRVLRAISSHPLNKGRKVESLARWISWQIGSRLVPGAVVVDWVDSSRLIVQRGMAGATGNIYTGLLEYPEMCFLLHYLQENHVFVDVGANVGVYTTLASAVIGARSISIEPVPVSYAHLVDNIRINGISELVCAKNTAVGAHRGNARITNLLDATNHIVASGDSSSNGEIDVPIDTLDNILSDETPSVIKIDVEGFEAEVIAGGHSVLSKPCVRAVLVELNNSGRRYGYDDASIHNSILEFGFHPYSYDPLGRTLTALNGKNGQSPNTIYLRDKAECDALIARARSFSVHGRVV